MRFIITIVGLLILLAAPSADAAPEDVRITAPDADAFRDYWYRHGAELSRFDLRQARYGEYHRGDAVMVFVTESLNRSTQIKAERPGSEDIPVLKLNAMRKFNTGIYPYSTMTSVFSPVAGETRLLLPLKISASVQEWCGQVFMQMNLKEDGYHFLARSYFEKDGDRDTRWGRVLAEDALWNLIRIAPSDLPQGEFEIVPGMLFSRLAHHPQGPQAARAQLTATTRRSPEGTALVQYALDLPHIGRRVVIWFEQAFPHRIAAWEEHGRAGDGKIMVTRAERTHLMMLDYWNHHADRDRSLAARLGLPAGD